jgi:hypothetical protein
MLELPRALPAITIADLRLLKPIKVHLANERREVRVLEEPGDISVRELDWVDDCKASAVC